MVWCGVCGVVCNRQHYALWAPHTTVHARFLYLPYHDLQCLGDGSASSPAVPTHAHAVVCRQHLFQLTPALQQFRLACSTPYAATIQQVPGTPPHRAFSVSPSIQPYNIRPLPALLGSLGSRCTETVHPRLTPSCHSPQAREINPKCERLLHPSPKQTRIASAGCPRTPCPACSELQG